MTDADKPSVVIFDIDGTVADCRHRIHHAIAEPPNWEAFFAGSDDDNPLPYGVALALEHTADDSLMWLTGRPEQYREVTQTWLKALGLPANRLHMRLDHDLRPAHVFKVERLAQISVEHEIFLIIDDDDLVVAALREAGWPVMHAQWMSS